MHGGLAGGEAMNGNRRPPCRENRISANEIGFDRFVHFGMRATRPLAYPPEV